MFSHTGEGSRFVASASFLAARRAASNGEPCSRSTDDTAPIDEESAGDILIDFDTRTGTESLRLGWDRSAKHYELGLLEGPPGQERIDLPGSTIRVRAQGATVPAFDVDVRSAQGTSFVAPADGLELDSGSGDVPLRWSPTADDDVFANLTLGNESITCIFAASASEGTIPGALVRQSVAAHQEADAGAGAGPTVLFLASTRVVRIVAGEHQVVVAHAVSTTRTVRVLP